jgi:predicted nucleotidyltransferase
VKTLGKKRMKNKSKIAVSPEKIANFCRRHRIRKLSFFGSVLRRDFRSGSDVDVLVPHPRL